MVILNNNEKETKTISGERFRESLEGFTGGYEVITGKAINSLGSFEVPPKSAMIIELK
jgi:hypothetical protein